MTGTKTAGKLVVGLMVAGLLTAFLLPIAVGAISGPEVDTITQNVGDTDTLQDDLNITLDSTNDGQNATYTVANDAGSSTATVTVGGSQTVTVDGTDVTITLDSAGTDSATADVEYPVTYGWGTGAASIWGVLPLLMVIAVFLYFVLMAMKSRM